MRVIIGVEGLYDEIDPLTLDIINKLTVEHLSTDEWNVKYNELVNLKSLVVKDYGSWWEPEMNFTKLEYVSLVTVNADHLREIFHQS